MAKWSNNEIEELKSFYKENNIPSDQLVKVKSVLDKFTDKFNERFSPCQDFTSDEIADRLFKLRKSGKLPRIRS